MKTQITKLLAAALMITATFGAQATTTQRNLKVSAQSQKIVVLQLANLASGTEITLVDENRKLLFKDKAEGERYAKTFDLNAIREGLLFLEIETEDKLEILPIEVSVSKAKIKKSAETIIEKAIVKTKGHMAKVFFGDSSGKMRVTIFDADNDIALRERVRKGTASKAYDLSDLADGSYQMQIRANGRTFYHTIILE